MCNANTVAGAGACSHGSCIPATLSAALATPLAVPLTDPPAAPLSLDEQAEVEGYFLDMGVILPTFHKTYLMGLTTPQWPKFMWMDPAVPQLNTKGGCSQAAGTVMSWAASLLGDTSRTWRVTLGAANQHSSLVLVASALACGCSTCVYMQ